jgi:hypothetical protein
LSRFKGQVFLPRASRKPLLPFKSVMATGSNMALNLAPFGRWTLCDKSAQRRLALL